MSVCAHGSKDGAREFALTILHTNDLHAHDESFMERGRSVGGMARIAYLLTAIRRTANNAVTVDAGDFFQGTTLFQQYGGEVEINLLNKLGYDIVALGNHEFDNGPVKLAKQLKAARFVPISCNLDFSQVPELDALVKPSVVKVVGGEKIAFIGAVTPDLEHVALKTPPVKVKAVGDAWMQPIAEEVASYKKQGINKIILVTHCGVELDKQLAESLSDVDAIVGGHSHTRLDEPIWAEHKDGTKTVIVQTGSYGRTLGKLELVFDEKGRLIEPSTQYHLININDRIKEDVVVADYVREKAAPLLKLRSEIVGFAEGNFDNRFNNMPWDSPIGDVICDALCEEGTSYGAKIAFHNRGGIRAHVDQGPISEEKVRELLPFENRIVLATISGDKLRAILERSVAGPLGGSFLDVRGIKFAYDSAKPKGERVIFALAENENGVWKPIEATGSYKIVINDYSFKGGQDYDFSGASDVTYLPDLVSDAFHNFLVKHKSIRPCLPHRIVPVTGGLAEVKSASGRQELMVHLTDRTGKTTIVFGKELGAQPLSTIGKTPFPVPLTGLCTREMAKGRISRGNACDRTFDLTGLKPDLEHQYAVVICRVTKSASGKAFKVSYPIQIDNLRH